MRSGFFVLFIILHGFYGLASSGSKSNKMEPIQNIGILPVQVDESHSSSIRVDSFIDSVKKFFPMAVKKSGRFYVINDELVENSIEQKEELKELIKEHELSGFMSLSLVPMDDTVLFIVRLLSIDLEIRLQEILSLTQKDLSNSSTDSISEKIEQLVFQLLNRLPIDVYITSIHEKYLTLSAGSSLGLIQGDKISLIRAFLASKNPANKSWLDFKEMELGKAEIIEVEKNTAIAQLIEKTTESSIEVGDGAKVLSAPSRARFDQKREKDVLQNTSKEKALNPLYSSSMLEGKDENKPQNKVDVLDDSEKYEEESSFIAAPVKEQGFYQSSMSHLSGLADDVIAHVGFQNWSFIGPGNASAKFVWYLPLNSLGLRVTRAFFSQFKYGIGGGIGFGGTGSGGSYFAYDSHARIFWEDSLILLNGIVQKWQAGGHSSFSGMSVNKEIYGGFDAVMVGVFASIKGQFIALEEKKFDWYAEASLNPLTLGRVGYDGANRLISSSLGYQIGAGVLQSIAHESIEWGFGSEYVSHSIADASDSSTGRSAFNMHVLSRWRF